MQIKNYTQQTTKQAVSGPNAPTDFEGGGIQSFGQGVQNLGEGLRRYSEEKDTFNQKVNLNKIRNDYLKRQEDRKNTITDPTGFSKGFEEDFDNYIASNNIEPETETGRKTLESGIMEIKGQFLRDSINYESQQVALKTKSDLIDIQNKSLNNITINPKNIDFEIKDYDSIVDSAPNVGMSAAIKPEIKKEFRFKAYDQALQTNVKMLTSKKNVSIAEINAFEKELKNKDSIWAMNTTNPQFEKAVFQLGQARETIKAKYEQDYIAGFPEYMKQVGEQGLENKLYTEANIKARVSPDRARSMIEVMKSMEMASVATNAVKGKSKAEIDQMFEEIKPKLKDQANSSMYNENLYFAKVLKEGLEARDKEQKEDGAGLAIKNVAVGERYKAVLQNPSKETAMEYASASVSEQRRLNPRIMPSVLPKERVDAIGDEIERAADSKDGYSKVAALMASEIEMYGPEYAPYVIEDLKKSKKINSSHIIAAEVIATSGNTYMAEKLIKSGSASEKEFFVTDDSKKNIKNAINNSLIDLSMTLGNAKDGKKIIAEKVDAFTKYAMQEASLKGGSISESEVSSIIDRGVNDNYVFEGTYRIPKKISGQKIDTDSVKKGIKQVKTREFLEQFDYVIPNTNTNYKDAKEQIIESILDYGIVQNNSDTGVVIAVDIKNPDTEGSQVLINLGNGKTRPLAFDFIELDAINKAKNLSRPEATKSPSLFNPWGGEDPKPTTFDAMKEQNSWRNPK